MTRLRFGVCVVVACALVGMGLPLEAAKPARVKPKGSAAASVLPTPEETAAKVDSLIDAALQKGGVPLADRCSDEDFLRRVSLDIIGVTPSTQDATLFGLDSESDKRAKLVERLLEDELYGRNWARYWRDVVFLRATSQFGNLGKSAFEDWMAAELQKNTPWDAVATSILTATGDIREQGQTALFAVHQAEPEEVAAEASRIFLGIQIQCANCHDHPTDRWKRDQFHEFAAFFPRVRFDRRMQAQPPVIQIVSVEEGGNDRGEQFRQMLADPTKLMKLLDRNKDNKLTKDEAQKGPRGGRFINVLIERGDSDKDGAITLAEIKNFPVPPERTGRGSVEYFMPDLDNPQSPGKKINPAFFLADVKVKPGLGDQERRTEIARQMTAAENPWFAKALVNRLWGQLLGEGFLMPIDDMGPDRTPSHPEAFDVLASAFAANKYDVKWLLRTILATEAYQRKTRDKDPTKTETFAHAIPTRLRGDQVFSSLLRVVGIQESSLQRQQTRMPGAGMRYGDRSPRGQFNLIFGFDPSTAPDELNGTVPQSLFLMNEPQIQQLMKSSGPTRLAEILKKFPSDKDAVSELYLLVHTREPSENELKTCQDYVKQVGNRGEAFEDVLWSLVNSTEFLTKR